MYRHNISLSISHTHPSAMKYMMKPYLFYIRCRNFMCSLSLCPASSAISSSYPKNRSSKRMCPDSLPSLRCLLPTCLLGKLQVLPKYSSVPPLKSLLLFSGKIRHNTPRSLSNLCMSISQRLIAPMSALSTSI